MAKVTTKPEEEQAAPGRSVSELTVEGNAARAEHARLQERASGEVGRWVTRREERVYVTQTGQPATAMVETPVWETEQVGPIERLRARRQLPALADRISLIEEQLEQAKTEAVQAARSQRTRGVAAGESVLRREWPALRTELRAVQERLRTFAAELEALDGAVGSEYFIHRSPAFLVQQIEGWLGGMAEAFPDARR